MGDDKEVTIQLNVESTSPTVNYKTTQNVDELYRNLGEPGRFQILVYIWMAVLWLSVSSNMVAGVFFAYTPPHECTPKTHEQHTSSSLDNGHKYTNNVSTGYYDEVQIYDGGVLQDQSMNVTRSSCSAVIGNRTYTCSSGEVQYDLLDRESTAVTEFDLVCERTHLRYMANTLVFTGIMIGSFLFGYLSDVIGRRPVIIITMVTCIGVGVAIVFVQNFPLFVFLRFIMGLSAQGLLSSTYIMLVEQFSCKYRGGVGASLEIFWSLGIIFLSAVAWLALDWRLIQLIILAPLVISTLYIWFLPESLRWLLAKGKTARGGDVIRRITWVNGIPNPVDNEDSFLSDYQVQVHEEKTQASYIDLIRVPELRKRTACMGFVCFAVNVGYFGMTFHSAQLAGDRYFNFFLASIVELLAMGVGTILTSRFGRKRPLIFMLGLGSVCCLIAGVFPREKDGLVHGTAGTVVSVVSVLGRAVMCMNFCVSDLFPSELYPTVIRNMGVGVCVFFGRLGAVLTPQIFALADQTFPQLPPLVFCVVTITAAFVTCFLPETSLQNLPDTVMDIEEPDSIEMTTTIQPEKALLNTLDIATMTTTDIATTA